MPTPLKDLPYHNMACQGLARIMAPPRCPRCGGPMFYFYTAKKGVRRACICIGECAFKVVEVITSHN